MNFITQLKARWQDQDRFLCVGLDPDIERLPQAFRVPSQHNLYEFNRAIIDASAEYVCAFKVQIAFYSALRAELQLEATIDYIHTHYPGIPVILDAKRGDIGNTARQYAREAFERYQADAVTVNPYMGEDSITPFLEYQDKGCIILCRTSNKGSGLVQEQLVDGLPLYGMLAKQAACEWNRYGNVGLVVGATEPQAISLVRQLAPDLPLLVPGIGAQGGDLQQTVIRGLDSDGQGLIINISRAILYPDQNNGDSWQECSRKAAFNWWQQIKKVKRETSMNQQSGM